MKKRKASEEGSNARKPLPGSGEPVYLTIYSDGRFIISGSHDASQIFLEVMAQNDLLESIVLASRCG